MRIVRPGLLPAFAFCTISSVATAQGFYVVDDDAPSDPGPGNPGVSDPLEDGTPAHPFDSLQEGIDAASSGDLVLVRAGGYGAFSIAGKGLFLVADTDSTVDVLGASIVEGVPSTTTVVLAGLSATAEPNNQPVLHVRDNAGTVRIEDCLLDGVAGSPLFSGKGTRVEDSAQVVITRCELRGEDGLLDDGFFQDIHAGPGLFCAGSHVVLHHGTCTGGIGAGIAPDVGITAYRGGAGLEVESGVVRVMGTELRGGKGGPGRDELFGFPCSNGGPGGFGLTLGSGAPVVELLDVALVAGLGGKAGAGGCSAGSDGEPLEVTSGAAIPLPGAARGFAIPSPLRENEVGAMTLTGEPGDLAWIVVGGDGLVLPFDVLGVLLVNAPFRVLSLGTLDGTGELEVPFELAPFPNPATTWRPSYYQGLFFNETDSFRLANGQVFVRLDEGA